MAQKIKNVSFGGTSLVWCISVLETNDPEHHEIRNSQLVALHAPSKEASGRENEEKCCEENGGGRNKNDCKDTENETFNVLERKVTSIESPLLHPSI